MVDMPHKEYLWILKCFLTSNKSIRTGKQTVEMPV